MKTKLAAIAFLFALLAIPQASAAYLWTASGNSPTYPPIPMPLPAISNLQYGHCYGNYGTNCVYYRNDIPFPPHDHMRTFNIAVQKPLPPGLGMVGWRYENGRYVRDVYEGYGNAYCRGRYC